MSAEILVRARNRDASGEVVYDPAEGIDVLKSQLFSFFADCIEDLDFALLDDAGRTITSSDDIEDIKLTKYDQSSGNITDSGHKAAATLANHTDATDVHSRVLESKPDANIPSDAAGERNDSVSILDSPFPAISANEASSNNSNLDSQLCLRTARHSADIWCISSALQDPSNFCTGLFFDAAVNGGGGKRKSSNSYTEENEDALKNENALRPYDVLQPCYRIVETSIHLCSKCASLFDSSLIVSEGVNLSVFTCMSEEAIRIGLAYPGAAEALIRSSLLFASNTSSPVVLHTERSLMHSALKLQVSSRNSPSRLSRQSPKIIWRKKESENRFRSQLLSGCVTVTRFEDQERLRKALLVIDFDKIRAYSKEVMAQRGSEDYPQSNLPASSLRNSDLDSMAFDDMCFIEGLLRWFKCDFFKWCGKPDCETIRCGGKGHSMEAIGSDSPSERERVVGGAGVTELYRCKDCRQITRFPRYNDPSVLLETRKGRCGEWANCFCLLCRALNLDVRYVLDLTDHVWAEVWVPALGRYVHLDPCERAFDKPLMYESGWNKNLTHVISFSRYGAVNATSRYTRKLAQVILRRSADADTSMDPHCIAVTEEYAAGIVHECNEKLRKSFSLSCLTPGGDELSESVMKKRKRLLDRELLGMEMMRVEKSEVQDLEGRISGDVEWKLSRGEIGKPSTATHGAAGVKGEGGLEGTLGAKEGEAEVEVEDDSCLVLQYVCLGGKVHEDTVAFDSTHCLWSLLQLLNEECESTTPASPTDASSAISQDSCTGQAEEHSSTKGNNKDEDKNKETEKGGEIKVEAGVHAPSSDKEEAHGEDVRGVEATPLQCLSFPSSSVSAVTESALIRISQYQDIEDKHFHRPRALHPRPVTTRTPLTPSLRKTWASLMVTDITVFAGRCHVNGISVKLSVALPVNHHVYADAQELASGSASASASASASPTSPVTQEHAEEESVILRSPTFSSDFDQPSSRSIHLLPSQRIKKVGITSGNIIDCLSITIAEQDEVSGKEIEVTHTFGSAPGSTHRSCTIPLGWKFLGLFGGTGGHLHNLGIVIMKDAEKKKKEEQDGGEGGESQKSDRTDAVIASSTSQAALVAPQRAKAGSQTLRLLGAVEGKSLWSCLWLNYKQDAPGHHRLACVGTLLSLVRSLYGNNTEAKAVSCVTAVKLYCANLIKNHRDPKYRSVKTSNKYFQDNILGCVGGLEMFCFGPMGFQIQKKEEKEEEKETEKKDEGVLKSCVKLILEGGDTEHTQWVAALTSYSSFLQDITQPTPSPSRLRG